MVEIPLIGFGTYDIPRSKTENCVRSAIGLGYRLIDTAQMYGNEAEVGKAVRGCGVSRTDLFITMKLSSPCLSKKAAVESFHRSLERMGLDYVDLALIHWPQGGEIETWKALEQMHREGLVKHIGVSNFYPRMWEKLWSEAEIKPCINQIEANVFYQQRPMREYMGSFGCAVQAWQPLGEGASRLLGNAVLKTVGANHGKTPAQVALRYLTQLGISAVPRSTNPAHMKENIDILDFTLDDDEMKMIQTLDTGHTQYGWPADAWNY